MMPRTGESPREIAVPTAIDLFCGAGGMSLGFERAGFAVLAALDSDPVHLATYERNFPLTYASYADLAIASAEDIVAAARKGWSLAHTGQEWDESVDCVFGGPSCQGFSDMGNRDAYDPRNELVFAFARVVEELQPRSFVMENVPGILNLNVQGQLRRLVRRFRNAGYRLAGEAPCVLDASDFGVPQFRKRVFLIGVSRDMDLPELPAPCGSPTVSDALDDLPNCDLFEDLIERDVLELSERSLGQPSGYVSNLRRFLDFEYRRRWDASVLTGYQRTSHSSAVRRRFSKLAQGQTDNSTRTSRLVPQSRSLTLRAGSGLDHGSYTAPRPIHHRYDRVITVREAARLHSYPDWFSFHVTKWHALRQIGNSVPPALAYSVAKSLIPVLGRIPVKTRRLHRFGEDSLLQLSTRTAAERFEIDKLLLPVDVRRNKELA